VNGDQTPTHPWTTHVVCGYARARGWHRTSEREVVNYDSYSYSAPTALGIRQEVERIRDNVFYLTFLTVFYIFSGMFFTSMMRNAALSYY